MVLRYFLPGFILILVLSIVMVLKIRESEQRQIEDEYSTLVLNGARQVQSNLAVAPSALRVSMLLAVQRLAAYDGAMPPLANLTRDVQLDFMNWLRLWPTFAQVRYVSASGAELVRVSAVWDGYDLVSLGAVPDDMLAKNLTGTADFNNGMGLAQNEVFVDRVRFAGGDVAAGDSFVLAYTAVYPIPQDTNITAGDTKSDLSDADSPLGYVTVTMRTARIVDALHNAMATVRGTADYVFTTRDGSVVASSDSEERTLRANNYSFPQAYPGIWDVVGSSETTTETVEPVEVHLGRDGLLAYVSISPCSFKSNPYVVLAACNSTGVYHLVVVASHSAVAKQQSWAVWPLIMAGLAVLLWLGVAVSFTKSNAATEALLRNSVSVEQFRSRNKELFLATMCHELRSPLNVIVGAVSLMDGPDLPDSKAPILKLMEGSADMLMAIVNDVLDISRIEAGHMELDPQPCNLRKSLEACVDVHASVALRKGLNVYLTYDHRVPDICVFDFPRLRQVISNLLSNAVKFTSNGHVEVTIRGLSGPPSSSSSRRRKSIAAVGHKPASEFQRRKAKSRRGIAASCGSACAGLGPWQRARRWLGFSRGSGGGGGGGSRGGSSGAAPKLGSGCTFAASGDATPHIQMAPSFSALREGSDASAKVDDPDLECCEERNQPESSSDTATADMVWLEISVTDTGKGIAEERQNKMFDPYTQEDIGSTRQFGGTGLGLAISKRLVELWGGTITIVSKVDVGSTFSVTVPVALSSSPLSPPSPQQPQDHQPLRQEQQEQQRGKPGFLPLAPPLPLPVAPPAVPLTLAVADGTCLAHAEALQEGTVRAGHRLRRFPTFELLVKATALEAVGMGKRASLIGEAGGHVSAIVIDSEMVREGLPRTVHLLQEAHPGFGLLVLLGSKWASLLGHSDLAGCFVISMPVTAAKVKDMLLRMAAGGPGAAALSNAAVDPAEPPRRSSGSTRRGLLATPLPSSEDVGSADSADMAAGGAAAGSFALRTTAASERSERASSGAASAAASAATAASPPSLPVASLGAATAAAAAAVLGAAAAAAAQPPPLLRALVVDDVSANRRILQHMLELQGVIADAAADGFEALAMEREADPPYDLVYMDLHMPGKDGVEATQAIRSRHAEAAARAEAAQDSSGGSGGGGKTAVRLKRPHMVMLTASALSSDKERCLAAGVDAFLSKPVTRNRLAESVAECRPRIT